MSTADWSLLYPCASVALTKSLVSRIDTSTHEKSSQKNLERDLKGVRKFVVFGGLLFELIYLLSVVWQHSSELSVIVVLVTVMAIAGVFRNKIFYDPVKKHAVKRPFLMSFPLITWVKACLGFMTMYLPVPHRPPR